MSIVWLIPIGFFVGAYGTLIGAGGGFILVPLLLFLSPEDQPSAITAASLAVILVNAVSGTFAYARMRRISYKTGGLFALATIPGAILGSYLTGYLPRSLFGIVFGALLIAVAVFLIVSRTRTVRAAGVRQAGGASLTSSTPAAADTLPSDAGPPADGPASSRIKPSVGSVRSEDKPRRFPIVDVVTDREGRTTVLSYNIWLGMGMSLLIGCFSSIVGIGWGLIHVPVLMHIFGFPLHVATATSHFILVFTALTGVVTHIIDGTFPKDLPRLLFLAIGVVLGAQLGAFASRKISVPWIVVGLAVALGLVGVRLIVTSL